jgi:hypothetical protein
MNDRRVRYLFLVLDARLMFALLHALPSVQFRANHVPDTFCINMALLQLSDGFFYGRSKKELRDVDRLYIYIINLDRGQLARE